MLPTEQVMTYAMQLILRNLKDELGWEPSLQFEEGIEKTVAWYLDNKEWLENITSGDYKEYYEKNYNNK